jgi:hypothetical protein
MTRLVRLTTAALAVALLAALPAGATTVRWDETAVIDHARVMHYKVDSITLGSKGWSAHVSFVNTSKQPVKVGDQFGLAFYAKKSDSSLSKAIGFAQATTFSSKVPATLKPGATWSGTISGAGNLTVKGTIYERVVFGPFTGLPGEAHAVVWITNHALAVGAKAKKAAPPPGNVA